MTEQEKREKVIKGLECCARDYGQCGNCPYEDLGGGRKGCGWGLYDDTLALLKAQEPMDDITLDEFKELIKHSSVHWINTKDYVPVVRCRDCKYWETDWNPNNSMDGEHFCPMISLATSGDWYCADGERRDENALSGR